MRRVAIALAVPAVLLLLGSSPGLAQAASADLAPSKFESLRNQADEAKKAKDWPAAARLTRDMLNVAPDAHARAYIAYDLACLEALGKRPREALQALAEAVRGGYVEWQHAAADKDLRSLRGRPEFKQLIVRMKALSVPMRIFQVTRWDNPDLGWASLHRFDEPNQAKLKQLRDEYRLAEVIAGKQTEFDKQIALMTWVHGVYFHHISYNLNNNVYTRDKRNRDVDLIRSGERHELLFQGYPQEGHAQAQDHAQIYPRLNLVHIDLAASGKQGAVSNIITTTLTHSVPGFDHYRISENGRSSQHRSDKFSWTLVPGPNALEIRAVNQAGVVGPPSRVDITYHPPAQASAGP